MTSGRKGLIAPGVRGNIYLAIKNFPGIHFRELLRKIDCGSGNLSYHLISLEQSNLIKSQKSKGTKRFYSANLSDYEIRILGILSSESFRKIILKLLSDNSAKHKVFVDFLNLSPSTVTWHLNKLVREGIITSKTKGREKFYRLKNGDKILGVIKLHKNGFFDKIIDRFVEAWEN